MRRIDSSPGKRDSSLAELGYEELTLGNSFFALGAPAGTPSELLEELEATQERALSDEETLETTGGEYVPEDFTGAEELSARIEELRDAYEPIVQ